mmetsp:Transcript_13654/g.29596  ORF Transcript_13654/g.29596 Transcript_13654/m.29596 type:complete len:176 (+) Transcript_13654:170-697(+)
MTIEMPHLVAFRFCDSMYGDISGSSLLHLPCQDIPQPNISEFSHPRKMIFNNTNGSGRVLKTKSAMPCLGKTGNHPVFHLLGPPLHGDFVVVQSFHDGMDFFGMDSDMPAIVGFVSRIPSVHSVSPVIVDLLVFGHGSDVCSTTACTVAEVMFATPQPGMIAESFQCAECHEGGH